MYIRILITFTIIASSFSVQSQVQRSAELYYSRYEGMLADQTKTCANLIRSFNQVSGNVEFIHQNPADSQNAIENSIVTGTVQNDSTLLKAFGQKKNLFSGIMTTEEISGNWTNRNGASSDFTLDATYPKGSMALDVSYLKSEMKLSDEKKDSPTATIELTFIYPKMGYPDPGIADSVQKIIKTGFFGQGLAPLQADSLLLAFEAEYYQNYHNQNQQWLETGGHSFSWEKLINTEVVYNSNYVLCLEFERYAYTGGAHGMSHMAYQVMNLKNGRLLTLQDIFVEGSEDKLSQLLTDQLKESNQINSDSLLTKTGYFVDTIIANRNIYVNGSGIGFVYNNYEIAPYSFGATNIFLKYSQISSILKPDSPVFDLSTPYL